MKRYNVVWKTLARGASDSMPIGNGDIGLNVWVEKEGQICFYIGKTDAWSENHRLLKVGRVRVELTPNPFHNGGPFRQTLNLERGEILIEAGRAGNEVSVRLWVDAHNPTAEVDVASAKPVQTQVLLETWREHDRTLLESEMFSVWSLMFAGRPVTVTRDTVVPPPKSGPGRLAWYHRNETSCWRETHELQGMGKWAARAKDPLTGHTFGAMVTGSGLVNRGLKMLRTEKARRRTRISVCVVSKRTKSAGAWLAALKRKAADIESIPVAKRRSAHRAWWRDFWKRSWVHVTGGRQKETGALSLGWHLHRYVMACTGRGVHPIKFNGSIFTVSGSGQWGLGGPPNPEPFDADYRRWGGPYWFQNTRQIYWPMLAAGDTDLMLSLFRMYSDALPYAKARTKKWYDHDGAFFPETLMFWGAFANDDYGWNRKGLHCSEVTNGFIRYYWQSGLELSAMMLDYYAHTRDRKTVVDTVVPVADAVVTFYDQHYPRNAEGEVHIAPAQALETWWDAENPTPTVAGLHRVLNALLSLPRSLTSTARRKSWRAFLNALPEIPVEEREGKQVIAPAKIYRGDHVNSENCELYTAFPYRLYGVGKPELKMLRDTYDLRRYNHEYRCWHNNSVFAAYAGLASEARVELAKRFTRCGKSRFPAFYADGDWEPDHDCGGVAQQTLQAMLMQADPASLEELRQGKPGKIHLFPAWPKEWDVDFKLHAPGQTTVEGVYSHGKLRSLKVSPRSRRADVVVGKPQ